MPKPQVGSAVFVLVLLALGEVGCANTSNPIYDGDGGAGNVGTGTGVGASSGAGGSSGGVSLGDANPNSSGGGGPCLTCTLPDATVADAGSDATMMPPATGPMPAIRTITTPDCVGCTFPPTTAAPCPSAPAIQVVYPADTVLLPPNLNVISIQWTPYGAPFKQFEVDFNQPTGTLTTDWRIITACKTQTADMQTGGTGTPSGGCEVTVDPVSWSYLVAANRGGTTPMTVTVRGTTDGTCASTSANAIHVSIAEEDLLGTYYYWKSLISGNGVGGQIWAKVFGDLGNPEQDVTSKAVNATCNGCHSLSRDGSRMVIYSDDDDSDDEYSDMAGTYLDMTTTPATAFPGGVTKGGNGGGGQPPGFSAINPLATYYVSSNGYPLTAAGKSSGASNGYPTAVPTNGWSLWNGTSGAFSGPLTIGPTGQRPTMPDWSIDGTTAVYAQPAGEYTSWRKDDTHIYGGSLYTVPYMGSGVFGTATVFLQSAGENNYYPSYSPDNPMSFILFNRVENMSAGMNCTGTSSATGFCLDDSFSNPAARLMLIGATAAGGTPIDLERANGSTVAQKIPLSNSYPRWAPFLQSYHGNKIFWFTFSSTRDYGVRILNHKTGMYQCYPSDTPEWPTSSHGQMFDPKCQEPQLWMAPLTFTEAQSPGVDPSGVAFWIPYQDMGTHNHTAQWTWKPNPPPPPPDAGQPPPCTCSMVYGPCGAANGGCGCCDGQQLVCTGSGQCIHPAN